MESFSKIILEQRKGYKEVFIYYSRYGAKFRESTKVKIFDIGIVDIKGVLNDPSNRDRIQQLQQRIENLIRSHLVQYEEKPLCEWLRLEFNKLKLKEYVDQSTVISDDAEVMESMPSQTFESQSGSINDNIFFYWPDFIDVKRQTTRTEGTIKRYNNLLVTVQKFKQKNAHKGYGEIGMSLLNQAFFNDLLYYMIKEHEYFRNTKSVSNLTEIPEVGLSNETVIKRLTDLVEYLGYCKRRKNVAVDTDAIQEYIKIAKFKFGVIKQCDSKKWELTLTPEELQFTINLDYYEPEFYDSLSRMQKKYLDILVFMCLQGTAPVDTQKIKSTDIVRGKLVGDRRKTRNGFKVELDPVAEQILQAYDYNLTFTDQKFNDAIKKLFITIFELYRPYFEDKYEEEYQLIYTQRKSKGDEEFLLVQHKGLFTEAMTGRRTFITNLNEETNEIGMRENMRRTGHARIQTHLGYQKDRQTGKNPRRRSLFGVSKINQLQSIKQVKSRLKTRRNKRITLHEINSQ